MNKKDTLISKLEQLEIAIDDAKDKVSDEEKSYLDNYKERIMDLRLRVNSGNLPASNGGLLGVLRAVSEYDSLSSIKSLYIAASDAERYYSLECKKWD